MMAYDMNHCSGSKPTQQGQPKSRDHNFARKEDRILGKEADVTTSNQCRIRMWPADALLQSMIAPPTGSHVKARGT